MALAIEQIFDMQYIHLRNCTECRPMQRKLTTASYFALECTSQFFFSRKYAQQPATSDILMTPAASFRDHYSTIDIVISSYVVNQPQTSLPWETFWVTEVIVCFYNNLSTLITNCISQPIRHRWLISCWNCRPPSANMSTISKPQFPWAIRKQTTSWRTACRSTCSIRAAR